MFPGCVHEKLFSFNAAKSRDGMASLRNEKFFICYFLFKKDSSVRMRQA